MEEQQGQQRRGADRAQRKFSDTIEFIGGMKATMYTKTSNPQLVEVSGGRVLHEPTSFECAIELQRIAERVLTPTENCVFAALCEGRITEEAIHPQRLESIRAKCLREWRRVGLLPLNTFLRVAQNVIDADETADRRRREAEQHKRDAERKEAERQQRIEAAKLLRMRPRDRRVAAKIEKERAA